MGSQRAVLQRFYLYFSRFSLGNTGGRPGSGKGQAERAAETEAMSVRGSSTEVILIPSPDLEGRKERRSPKAWRQPAMAFPSTFAPGRKKISRSSPFWVTARTDLLARAFF